ncbi:Uncharacterised ACR, YkgG family COG1556 [Alkalispirochaeta americana]|uniref:Uncharacterized ACR, YkgG family COG1556 n=1 Tax=Alkalispirochaeta americana TaxID=159291 RepID=A0A1N6SNB1_9SPIO|nr:lactate utilization protein [Alkalispirochaeta americana]SIQ42492.1 Uncharacterised ACR, YkgG family COG1556 [Alkalispirochaeta americana]
MEIKRTVENLEKNGFLVYMAETTVDAQKIVLEKIIPEINPSSISYGDSLTLEETFILDELRREKLIRMIEPIVDGTFDTTYESSRKGLLADLFMAGTNAITEQGELVNLDMVGNRIAGIIFGPKSVVLTVGTNKIVKNKAQAYGRIKKITAPRNAKRNSDLSVPCQETGICSDCTSEDRICNYWSIIDKCFPAGKIRIVLINESIGL